MGKVIKPVRVQRKRTKGFSLQAASQNGLPVVYVGRPSQWGNPYRVGDDDPMLVGNKMSALDAVRMYNWHLAARPYELNLEELRGKNLACWCPLDQPCHADVLLALANIDFGCWLKP